MTETNLTGAVRSVNGAARRDTNLPTTCDRAATGTAAAPVMPDDVSSGVGFDLPDLRTLLQTAAMELLDRLTPASPALPSELRSKAVGSVVSAVRRTFGEDDLFLAAQSRLTSVATSLQRREGTLLQTTFLAAVDATPHLVIVPTRRMGVTRNVVDLVARLGHEGCSAVDLQPSGDIIRTILPDVVLVDARAGVGWVVELKRGAQLGAQHGVRLADDVAAGGLLVQHHLRERGYDVRAGRSAVIAFRQDAGLRVPDGLNMSLDAFDARFATQVAEAVSAIRTVHAAAAAIALRPLQVAALIESDAALYAHPEVMRAA